MPASEFLGWQSYFSIYPFTVDREDARAAMLAAVISNMSGKKLKREIDASHFLPKYLRQEAPVKQQSAEQQSADMRAWFAKYKRMEKAAKGITDNADTA